MSRLCERLRAKTLVPFFDRWSLTPGRNWQGELLTALDAHKSIAVCLGPAGLGDWQKLEIEIALTRHAREGAGFPVIPVLLPGVDPAKLGLGFLKLSTWVDFRDEGEAGLDTLIAAIRGQPPGPDARLAADARAKVNPYRGLEFFREEDAPFFFGRDAFSDEVARAVVEAKADASLVAIVGDSGSGKSSIAQAGLLPRLRDPTRALFDEVDAGSSSKSAAQQKLGTLWSVLAMSPGEKPVDRLAELLAGRFELSPSEHDREFLGIRDGLLTEDKTAQGALGRYAGRIVARDPRIGRLLLLVDQFEEVFTLASPKTAPAAERFVEELVRAARDPSVPLTVVVTLRGDQYHHVTNRRALARLFKTGQVNVGPLERAELRRAVEEPAKALGARFEAGLVERILDDVGAEPGALPLLEYALDLLWARRDSVSGALTHAAYEAIGGVKRAIAARADEVYGKLTPEEQAAAQAVLLRLVRPGEGTLDSKRPGTIEEADEPAARALAALSASRLVVAGAGRIEITHEALIREWSTLRGWIDAKREALSLRQRLDAEARHWEEVAQRDRQAAATLLLSPGLRLEEGRKLLVESGGLLSGFLGVRRFIEDSVAADAARVVAQQAKLAAERRRGRHIAVAGFLAAFVFAGLGAVAGLNWKRAAEQTVIAREREAEAQQEKQRAEAEKARADKALADGIGTADALTFDLVQKFENYGVPKPVLQAMLERVLKLQQDLAAGREDDARLQRSRSVALGKVGDVLVARNDLAGALKAYEADKAIFERLAAADPSNAQAARDVSVSLLNIGLVLRQANQTVGACRYDLDSRANLRAYRARSGQPEAFASDVAWLDLQIAALRCDEAAWTAGRLGREAVEAMRAGDYARALGAPGAARR